MLDLFSVRLFVLAVDLGSLTHAAEAAGTVQPAVSQRLRALEATVGCRLLDRTPRYTRLTKSGEAFLPKARTLLAAHDAATSFAEGPPIRFTLGASDHALGGGLRAVIRSVRAALPSHAQFEVRLGMSSQMRPMYDAGELDALIIRREASAPEGELMGRDAVSWRAAPNFETPDGAVLLASMGEPCGVRASALRRLDEARRPWREVFTGGSCATVMAAVHAGLGVAAMGDVASEGMPDMGASLGLPALPSSEIVLFARTTTQAAGAAVLVLAAATRHVLASAR